MRTPIIVNDFSDGKCLFVKCFINKIESTMLLDTGSSHSVLDLRKISKYSTSELTKNKPMSSFRSDVESYGITIHEFSIDDYSIKNKNFQVIDLINLNNAFSSNYISVVDGILGNDILIDMKCKIDLENLILKNFE